MSDLEDAIATATTFETESADSSSWPEPEKIKDELSPVPPFERDLLPSPLAEYVMDVAHRMQCPPDFVAASLVTVLSTAIGARCAIKPKKRDSWIVVPNVWGGVVALPGKLKTPAIKGPYDLLAEMEKKADSEYDEALRKYGAELKEFKIRQEVLEKVMKDALSPQPKKSEQLSEKEREAAVEDAKSKLANLVEPMPPKRKRYVTQDANEASLHTLTSENPAGILVFRDELPGLLAKLDREDEQEYRAFILEGWAGDSSYIKDRVARGVIKGANICISIFGGIQPSKLASYLLRSVGPGNNDGCVQRFQLMVYPDPPTWSYIDEEPNIQARENVRKTIHALAATADYSILGAEGAGDACKFPTFHFDDDAQQMFKEWLSNLETKKLVNKNESDIVIEHLSKFRSLVPSLALIFHLVQRVNATENRANTEVGKSSLERALRMSDYLEAHARRIYGLILSGRRATKILSEKIESSKLPSTFSERDVYRNEWESLKTPDQVKKSCNLLVESGWLRRVDINPGDKGGRPEIMYIVNPKVKRKGSSAQEAAAKEPA